MDVLATAFFLPVEVLRRVFQGKFVDSLKQLHAEHKLGFHGTLAALQNPKAFAAWLRPLFRTKWVVYAKRRSAVCNTRFLALGQYTHRVAISNHRLVALADGMVTFRWRDSAHKNKKRLMTLPVDEFLRRFLLHVLPPGFVRIRYFGFQAIAAVAACSHSAYNSGRFRPDFPPKPSLQKKLARRLNRWTCPQCSEPMVLTSNGSAY